MFACTNRRPPPNSCSNGWNTLIAGPGTMFSSSRSAEMPTIRRGSALTPMNFMTGSVHVMWRFSASWFGNIRRATLWLTMTTFSAE